MKKVFIMVTVMLFLISIPLLAQEFIVDKGVVNIGGTISFESRGGDLYEVYEVYDEEFVKEMRVSVLSLNPSFLYFIMPNLSIGGEILYDHISAQEETFSLFGIGPKAAYFFGGEGRGSYPFVGASFLFAKPGEDGTITVARNFYPEGTLIRITPFVGMVFTVSKNVGVSVEAYAKIDSFKAKGGDKSYKGDILGLRLGIAGFIY